ncbi:MAG: hypothetical protein JXQ90_18325 [Cyclobacteriaceae bacterium]
MKNSMRITLFSVLLFVAISSCEESNDEEFKPIESIGTESFEDLELRSRGDAGQPQEQDD